MVKIGTVLIHPVHGEMTVTEIKPSAGEEFIAKQWRSGNVITAEFDRFIPGVHWRRGNGKNAISYLVFHEFYLSKLKVKKDGA